MNDKELHNEAMKSMLEEEKYTPGAMRVADKLTDAILSTVYKHFDGFTEVPGQRDVLKKNIAQVIDRETGLPELLEACEAAIKYDEAIQSCANDPTKMASFCSAQDESLDMLYAYWLLKTLAALKKATQQKS